MTASEVCRFCGLPVRPADAAVVSDDVGLHAGFVSDPPQGDAAAVRPSSGWGRAWARVFEPAQTAGVAVYRHLPIRRRDSRD